MRPIRLFLTLLAFSSFSFSNTVSTGHADVSLVKSEQSVSKDGEIFIGIRMDMQTHWHTYWKNPGDSGGPLKVIWDLPKNIEVSDVYWPAPELIPYPPLMTYGYEDFVIFPFKLKFPENEIPSYINADIDFLICDDICVPERAIINTSFDGLMNDERLDNWLTDIPSITLPVLANQVDNYLELRFSYNDDIKNIYFYIEEKDILLYASQQNLVKEENNWLLKIQLEDSGSLINNFHGVLSINDTNFLVDAEIQSESSSGNDNISVFQAILFAFIGGLILNLMPCVFPIISLKVLSFVSMGGESKNKIRKHSLSFCAGVVISFVLIAVALIGLKESGVFVGWGFQLQSPAIVGSLSILMFLIGIVLLMDINIGSSLTRLGSVGSGDDSYYGSFLTGVLAVVVASPCTAPFMGAAIGYALIQPSLVTIPIFLSLGLGFAAPYLMLSIKPELISSMPRPGKWMETLKEFFAFPMFATSVWLLWVFSLQTNTDALINLLVSLLIISMLIWIISKAQKSNQKNFLILLIILVIGYQISAIANLTDNKDQMNTNANLVNWDKDTEKDFKLANQAYLINFTAAWCITCQANDKIALSRPKVKSYLRDNDIEYIVADWTNRDKEILSVLNTYGRSGVPLYVYWKPGMQESKLLPAILTEQIIIDSL